MWDDAETLDRVKKCRRCSVKPGGDVGLRVKNGAAGFSGLSRCGSVWACPTCARKIARVRADEIGRLLSWTNRCGYTAALLTMTVKHHAGQRLRATWSAAAEALRDLRRSRTWAGESMSEYEKRIARWETGPRGRRIGKPRPVRQLGWVERFGVIGNVRLVEVTYGENGWHPHVHLLLIFDGPISQERAEAAIGELFPVWQKALQKQGYDAQQTWRNPDGSLGGALDIKVKSDAVASGLDEYFTKSLALEMTHSVTKTGKKDGAGLSPFQIAKAAYFDGDADMLEVWHEWARSSRGRQQLVWSDGLKDLVGVVEREDEEIAEEELGEDDQLILPAETWRAVRYEQVELLLVAEQGGIAGAIAWLDRRRLPWHRARHPDPAQERMSELIRKRSGATD